MIHGVMLLISFLVLVSISRAQGDSCGPCGPVSSCTGADGTFVVSLRDGSTIGNVLSARRGVRDVGIGAEQTVILTIRAGTGCRDTTLPVTKVSAFSSGQLGLDGQPCSMPVLPVREFVVPSDKEPPPFNFLEVTVNPAYTGGDESRREVGPSTFAYGAEALISPFGSILGHRMALALGGGVLLERDRLRFPVIGQLRIRFGANPRTTTRSRFVPGPCLFSEGAQGATSAPTGALERTSYPLMDSASYVVVEDSTVIEDQGLHIWLEGGPIFNGGFDGAGRTPSINADDYGQYLLGAGVGLPFADIFFVGLGYRFMRLNVRTPCEICPPPLGGGDDKYFVTNTTEVHSVVLKLGVHLPW